jgi:tyrosyl-tRNA synthetase
VYSLDHLRDKLEAGRPLRIKYGVDVTAPFLHIGHAVNLWMMRRFQERGHKVVFLIGDFTTQIGDPTGRTQARKAVGLEEIERNADRFIQQAGLVLDTDPEVFEVRRNSEWFGKMSLAEFLSVAALVTHSHLIKRDMFQIRIQNQSEIYIHEMPYPLLQGYDSYMLESDLTIVGSDQLFNELMGRFYQERFNQPSQVVMTTRITPGTDGKEKQSKSLGNYIAISDSSRDKYGKVMSIPDSLIIPYLEVYTEVPMAEVAETRTRLGQGRLHPMEAKKGLARAIVARYHGVAAAEMEDQWFADAFSERAAPEDVPLVRVCRGADLMEILSACLPDHSKAALRRLVEQGGVRINQDKVQDPACRLSSEAGAILKVGKLKWFKLIPG